jgi:hypothetical protein
MRSRLLIRMLSVFLSATSLIVLEMADSGMCQKRAPGLNRRSRERRSSHSPQNRDVRQSRRPPL